MLFVVLGPSPAWHAVAGDIHSNSAPEAGASMPDVGDLKMMWEGRNLEWDRPLADYGITTESKVLLCSRVHAAMEGTYMAMDYGDSDAVKAVTRAALLGGDGRCEVDVLRELLAAQAPKAEEQRLKAESEFIAAHGPEATKKLLLVTPTLKTISLDFAAGETVEALKEQIHAAEDIPVDMQRLVFGGSYLEDGRRLTDYDIRSFSTLHITLRLRG